MQKHDFLDWILTAPRRSSSLPWAALWRRKERLPLTMTGVLSVAADGQSGRVRRECTVSLTPAA
jgi:hypothetical protein